MAIITLTTDFGDTDHYVASFKGEILYTLPGATLVDICNTIPPFKVNRAAYILRNAFAHFPKRTIHIARVFEHSDPSVSVVACSYHGQYFLAPDNGLLSMVFDGPPQAAVHIDRKRFGIGSPHTLYCKAISVIAAGGGLAEIGQPAERLEQLFSLRPAIRNDGMQGVVTHVDYYGNSITNISKSDLEQALMGRRFSILLDHSNTLDRLASHYHDVPQGEALARFNNRDSLEIAVNCGRADELLGLKEGHEIKIIY